MKGGLAVMLALAEAVSEPVCDVTYVFYAREEVALEHNGLRELFAQRPELLVGDVAILGEPTSGQIEAGCQGTMRLRVELVGERAHTARAWMGTNAIHRTAAVLEALDAYVPREPEIAGCRFHEALQAVDISGGVAGNVVPDRVSLLINHRFAPDQTDASAEAHVRDYLAGHLGADDVIELVESSPAAVPGMDHSLLSELAERSALSVSAKLGWTDVAFFSEQGIPAINFGPGDALIAHTRDEFVTGESLRSCYDALARMLSD
jgi:succinyl-diaminopimelate desuccinylase